MCVTDKYPTEYNIEPVRIDEPAPAVEPAPTRGAVTLLEQAALKSVDVAEYAADPLNQFTLARAAVRTAATVARWVRRR